MSDTDEVEAGCLIALVPFVLSTIVVGPILRGWVFCKIWLWFLVPTFSVAPLRIPVAIGLMLAVCFAIPWRTPSDPKDEQRTAADKAVRIIAECVSIPLLTLGFAWVVKWFM